MTNWIDLINFAFAVGGLLVAVMGLVLSRSITFMDRRTRRFFIAFFSMIIAYIVSDLASQISIELLGPAFRGLSLAGIFLESLFSSLLLPLLTLYLLYCIGKGRRRQPVIYIVVAIWIVYFALLVVTQFTTEIYTVTADNVYQRGDLYPVLLVPPIILMAVNLAVFVRGRDQLSAKQRKAFMCYLLIPLGCMLVQAMSYGLLMIVIGTSVGAMLMFLFVLRDQTDRYIRQQEESIRQRNNVMLLQMRPHFIYNTMMSIYYLCKQDPDRAQQVILDFTTYLRKNFTAMAREETISFSEEMEHTRAYLAVEQVRFEGKLYVEFDTPHTAFRLPPLTLQPVVENAVKHGVDPEADPLHITVHTRKTDCGSEIIVTDTGPGYEPANDNEPHIALANIRERLKMMCGGELVISGRDGGGTAVTIVIPDRPSAPGGKDIAE
ncbi:MAG: histidine kinase [Clostridia bacterium]|nr:histidine kinase [Clostridia bacterium]